MNDAHVREKASKIANRSCSTKEEGGLLQWSARIQKAHQRKKEEFIEKLCRDIENNNNVKWDTLKALKKCHSSTTELDAFDMLNFCKFFKNLYGKSTLEAEKIDALQSDMAKDDIQDELAMILDKQISLEELTSC
ncbi:hypothetical protein ACHWQZ_G002090 [Mnemiopsis leidyi]